MEVNSIIQGVLFSFLLFIASYIDIKRRVIPEKFCILIALTALIDFRYLNLLGIFVALPLLIAAMCKEDSIGGGDIKLVAVSGIVLGFLKGMYGLMIGLSLLTVFYVFYVVVKKIGRKQVAKDLYLPLAPFLGLGFIIIYFLTLGGR